MPNPLEEQLTALARSIRLTQPTTPMPLSTGTFRVKLSPPGGQHMSLTETVTEIVLQNCDLNLGWLTKNVRFTTPHLAEPAVPIDVADRNVQGGMPVGDVLRLNIQNVTGSLPPGVSSLFGTLNGRVNTAGNSPDADTLPGVPGILGRITGSVQIPIQTTHPISHPVMVDVRWRIMDDRMIVTDVTWTLNPDGIADDPMEMDRPLSGSGGEITPEPNRALQPLQLVFPPAFIELTDPSQLNSPPTVSRTIHVSVRLQTQDTSISSEWIDLPPLTLTFPAIPVPTVLFLFKNSNFDDNILVVLPSNSPLADEATVNQALTALNTAISNLVMPLPPDAALRVLFTVLLGRLAELPGRIQRSRDRGGLGEKVLFRKADEIAYLYDVVFYWGIVYLGRDTAADSMSSLIFVGPPRRKVDCFNAPNFDDREGQMNVTIGPELIVEIRSMENASPSSTPPGRVSVARVPAGARAFFRPITTFDDEFSSLRFGWER